MIRQVESWSNLHPSIVRSLMQVQQFWPPQTAVADLTDLTTWLMVKNVRNFNESDFAGDTSPTVCTLRHVSDERLD